MGNIAYVQRVNIKISEKVHLLRQFFITKLLYKTPKKYDFMEE